MARKERRTAAAELDALLEQGDHRGARARARALRADPATPEPQRAEAAALLASLAPERGAVVAGAIGAAAAVAILAWTLLAR